jgi:hypothetical protein
MKVGFLALVTSFVFAVGFPLVAMGGAPDADGDGIPDAVDNCPTVPNANQANGDLPLPDAFGNVCDNCSARQQATGPAAGGLPGSCDSNLDGYGNACDGDFNNDGGAAIPDLTGFLVPGMNMAVPPGNASVDMNCDGAISIPDLTGFFTPQVNMPPGPSGKSCANPTAPGSCP